MKLLSINNKLSYAGCLDIIGKAKMTLPIVAALDVVCYIYFQRKESLTSITTSNHSFFLKFENGMVVAIYEKQMMGFFIRDNYTHMLATFFFDLVTDKILNEFFKEADGRYKELQ
jgi:hypothetical protein